RFALRSAAGLPSDSFYDFSPVTNGLTGRVATIGMLAVERSFRHSLGLVTGMGKLAVREIRRAGGRHIVAPVSPDIEPMLYAMGARQVGPVIHHGDPPVPMKP